MLEGVESFLGSPVKNNWKYSPTSGMHCSCPVYHLHSTFPHLNLHCCFSPYQLVQFLCLPLSSEAASIGVSLLCMHRPQPVIGHNRLYCSLCYQLPLNLTGCQQPYLKHRQFGTGSLGHVPPRVSSSSPPMVGFFIKLSSLSTDNNKCTTICK